MIPSVGLSYVVFAALPRRRSTVRQVGGRVNRVPPGPRTPCPRPLHTTVGRLGDRRRNSDLGSRSEVRVAQQLGTLASFPPLAVVVLFGIGVIHPTFAVAILFAVGLLVIDVRALRIVVRMFDRERLVTGTSGSILTMRRSPRSRKPVSKCSKWSFVSFRPPPRRRLPRTGVGYGS